jgi:uncharacterized membrane protein
VGEEVIAMMFWYGGHWAFWQAGLMWAGMVIFWGLLIWAAWALISHASRQPRDGNDGGDARRILDRRLARGEIDVGEYQRLTELIGPGDREAPADTGSTR